jgi:RNA polymerase sigma-70 factor (ECF subfamily)
MAQLARGETAALGELYMRHGQSTLRFLARTLRDTASAEDLCQDVFLTLPGAASRYTHQGQLRAWILGIAAKKARGWQRRQWVRTRLLGTFGLSSASTTAPTPETARSDAMAAAFDALPHDLREVLVLQVAEGLSGAEIAEVLGIGHGAVRVRLHRARQKLRERLAAMDVSPGAEP